MCPESNASTIPCYRDYAKPNLIDLNMKIIGNRPLHLLFGSIEQNTHLSLN